MQTVENPKKLFRKINATEVDENSYTFNVAEGDVHSMDRDDMDTTKITVEFRDLSDPADDFHASLAAIEQNATAVDDADAVPEDVDTKFHTQEGGRTITYMANTDRMGYEVIKQASDPRLAGYAVIFPDELVKVEA